MKYEWGNGKKTLVFLHGLGSTGLSFGELAQHLKDYQVISFDLPGHGPADDLQMEEDYQPSKLATKIDAEITALNLGEFYLAGHSWGGDLALHYAKKYPNRVKGVILLDGGYLPNEGSLEQELKDVDAFHDSVRFPSWEAFIESEKSEVDRWSKELEEASRSQVKMVDGELQLAVSKFTAKSVVKGLYAEPHEKVWKDISRPVLLLRGKVPEEMEELRRGAVREFEEQVPDAEVVAVPGTTHDIYRDAPGEVAGLVRSWINKHVMSQA